jgi:LacI family transcriptional regulator
MENLELPYTYQHMRTFLASPHPEFTAIFVINDNTTMGVMKALQEFGLRVPQDVSLVGFDDMEFAAFLQPPLTTIRVERREIGRLAVQRLLDRLTNPGLIPIRIEVQTRLIERQSVATITPALREA